MVYHEIREVNGKKKNYLIHNKRKDGKWVKKSKFIGDGGISKEKISTLKKKFEMELLANKDYKYLVKKDVEKIERLKEIYNKNIGKLEKEEYSKFQETFFTELTYNSNAIEGSTLSLQETLMIIEKGIVPEGKSLREIHEAKNHYEALNFLKNHNGDLNEELILKLHLIVTKNTLGRFSGKYRQTSIRVFGADVKFPPASKVPELIKNMLYWYKKNKNKYHQFELATIVSMKFVTIHPFLNGNGRVSRLLMNFLLSKKNYPWINVYNKHRQKYLEATRKANDEDYSLIFPFLIKTLEMNLKDFNII